MGTRIQIRPLRVIKHAGATEVRVMLKHLGNEVAVTVEDNGKGIEAVGSVNRSGFGLAGIQERARMLGGSCTVESRPVKALFSPSGLRYPMKSGQ